MVGLIELIGFTHLSPDFLKMAGMGFYLVLFVHQILIGARHVPLDSVWLGEEVLRFITKDRFNVFNWDLCSAF
jgi:hypothetical protein